MNNIICVYTGTKYNINHVNTLYNMVVEICHNHITSIV